MKMSFKAWWKTVNRHVADRIGMTADEMPDLCFVRDWFDDGMSPADAAQELLEAWVEDGCVPAELLNPPSGAAGRSDADIVDEIGGF